MLTPELISEIQAEIARAEAHGPMYASLHEAYAVIAEELDEVWDITRQKRRDRCGYALREELIQVIAVSVKAINSIPNFVTAAAND